MSVSRRRFLEVLGAAGVTISAGDWLFESLQAYAGERLGYKDIRGPGLVSFSQTVCRNCANHCALSVRKVDELPVGIRGTLWNPASRGGLCVAGQSQMQALFDPDRLKTPLQRADAGASATPVAWDEALGILQSKISRLIESGSGDRIALVDGRTSSLGTMLVASWAQSIPGLRYIPLRIETAMDRLARDFLKGAAGGRLVLDLARTGTLLLVGNEMLEVDGSPVSQMRAHADRREDPLRNHAPTLYLGPRRSPTGIKADYWIPCQAGVERDVLLAIAQTLSREHPKRASILPEYAKWVPEARDEVGFAGRFSLESVAQRHDLSLSALQTAVRALGQFAPAITLPGPGLLRQANGASGARAALALNLWTRGIGEEGGLSWGHDPLAVVANQIGLHSPHDVDTAQLADILEPLLEIKRSEIEVLICVEANLVHELPGRDQIERALSHVPFVASFSALEDEMSRVSHLTLPTLLEAESWDLPAAAWGVPNPTLQVQREALTPVVNTRSVEDVILTLASRGVAGPGFTPPTPTAKELVERAVDALLDGNQGKLVGPDGSRSLGASSAAKHMMSGSRVWSDDFRPGRRASRRVPDVTALPAPVPDLAPDQLWLKVFDSAAIQTGRTLNRPMMMELAGAVYGVAWESFVEIHPVDAKARGIATGDRVRIRGPRAEVSTQAVVTRTVHQGFLSAPVGFGHRAMGKVAKGRGANPLELPNFALDDETGVPTWGPVPVFVVKA